MMKLKIMTYETLEAIKNNLEDLVPLYEQDSPQGILETFSTNSLVDIGINCSNFTLKISSDQQDDFENVQKVYGTLKDIISPAMASDERLWAGLSMRDNCWKYINLRWKRLGWNKDRIKEHFYFSQGTRRSLTRNGLARLWWIGALTYDDTGKDPWHYTKFACTHQRFIVDVLERSTGNSKKLVFACIDACEQYQEEYNKVIATKVMRDIQKYMSILGGTYLIDLIEPSVLKEKLYKKIEQLNIETIPK